MPACFYRMVRNYVRKTARQSWDESNMQQAVLSVLNGDHGYKKAAEMYDVPKCAIERRVAKMKKNIGSIEEVCKKCKFFPNQKEE